jgi:DNA recombination protein RmuC
MSPILISLLTINALLIAGLFIYLLRRQSANRPGDLFQRVEQTIQQLSHQQSTQLQQTVTLVLQQLNKQQESQDRSTHAMHTRLDQTNRLFSEVHGKLLQQEEAVKRLFDLGKDIASLQSILQAPKLRGTMGEIWLEQLINQILPKKHFRMQYAFKSGEVCDAVITLRDGLILPIDSKFSLENFAKMVEAEGESTQQFRKLFISDTKRRIDEIAHKYIRPQEGTMEFAFMYVPAENVYYQAFIQNDDTFQLLNYAFSRHVIPVSPSSFYPYLQVVLFGLHGMEIEQSALAIQKNLSSLQGQFTRFREQYDKIGSHLRHAQSSYELADKRLTGIESGFVHIAHSEPATVEVPQQASLLAVGEENE